MLTFEQIKELIDQVASHRLGGVELERSGFRLKIDGHRTVEPAAVPVAGVPVPAGGHLSMPALAVGPESVAEASAPSAPAPAVSPELGTGKAPTESDLKGAHILHSPIVGTFYRSPNPDSPPYVGVGDRVKAGQVLCIVEAMKLMNEIESDVAGTVVEIYVENAQPVEYGEPLFAIRAK